MYSAFLVFRSRFYFGLTLGYSLLNIVCVRAKREQAEEGLRQTQADLAGVGMGVKSYHPGWVYHGLLVAPVIDAARVLQNLLAGRLLGAAELRLGGEHQQTVRISRTDGRLW